MCGYLLNDVDTHVVPVAQINSNALKWSWITPDLKRIENIFAITADPREYYKGYWAAGLDYHD